MLEMLVVVAEAWGGGTQTAAAPADEDPQPLLALTGVSGFPGTQVGPTSCSWCFSAELGEKMNSCKSETFFLGSFKLEYDYNVFSFCCESAVRIYIFPPRWISHPHYPHLGHHRAPS